MEYFYTPPSHISSTHLTIEGDEFVHLTHVMRKKTGEIIRVVDGAGNAYDAVIEEMNKRAARCAIHSHHHRLHEPALDVTLGVGVLKNHAKFDFLVEKCTELGVNTIIPLMTERTIPHHAKEARWQKLALAAMKQCGRCVLPRVHEGMSFDAFLKSTRADMRLIPHEKAESPMPSLKPAESASSVLLCIGPEGGFSDEEIFRAAEKGFHPVSLGARRLRTETAAIISSGLLLLQR